MAGIDVDVRIYAGMVHDWSLLPIVEARAALTEAAALIRGFH